MRSTDNPEKPDLAEASKGESHDPHESVARSGTPPYRGLALSDNMRGVSKGRVVDVSDRIAIDIGSVQGLRVGDRLPIFRLSGTTEQKIGLLSVITVYKNRAYGIVNPTSNVQIGDRVHLPKRRPPPSVPSPIAR